MQRIKALLGIDTKGKRVYVEFETTNLIIKSYSIESEKLLLSIPLNDAKLIVED